MPLHVHPGTTDLLLPAPGSDPGHGAYTVYTHYFSAIVPEARIGIYAYLRCQPGLGLSQGGVSIYRGLDNLSLLDAEHHDYRATMPWPTIHDAAIDVPNGMRIEVPTPGEHLRLLYGSPDGEVVLEVDLRALTPLVARGHVADIDAAGGETPAGGSEQLVRATGRLLLHGERHEIDCATLRDRSWGRERREPPGGGANVPPLGWVGVHFPGRYSTSHRGFEPADTDPAWLGVNELPGGPHHIGGWLQVDGRLRGLRDVRRTVHERHPITHVPLVQSIEVTDDDGRTVRFDGEAIAAAPVTSWPNIEIRDAVYRWTDRESGDVAHSSFQEGWYDRFQRAMKHRRPALRSPLAVER